MNVILATGNPDKVQEIQQILPDPDITFLTMREAGFTGDIVEDGSTFEENALIKARAVHWLTGGFVLADDSGLAVDVLDGQPGIYSARFAGEDAGYPEKIKKLHEMLSPWPPEAWDAAFICVMALIHPDGKEETFRGECRGKIATEMRGTNGFGYDPIFYLPDRGKTTAELSGDEKHEISHRGKALRLAAQALRLAHDGRIR